MAWERSDRIDQSVAYRPHGGTLRRMHTFFDGDQDVISVSEFDGNRRYYTISWPTALTTHEAWSLIHNAYFLLRNVDPMPDLLMTDSLTEESVHDVPFIAREVYTDFVQRIHRNGEGAFALFLSDRTVVTACNDGVAVLAYHRMHTGVAARLFEISSPYAVPRLAQTLEELCSAYE